MEGTSSAKLGPGPRTDSLACVNGRCIDLTRRAGGSWSSGVRIVILFAQLGGRRARKMRIEIVSEEEKDEGRESKSLC